MTGKWCQPWWPWLVSQGMLALGMGVIVFSDIMSPDFNGWNILSLVFGSFGFVVNLITLRQWRRKGRDEWLR